MTPVNRERYPVDMMDNDTPSGGNDSIDLTNEWPPLQDESDETVALALEQRKNDALVLADRVTSALLNDGKELSDDDVTALLVLGNDLRGLAAELSGRFPSEHPEQREREESA